MSTIVSPQHGITLGGLSLVAAGKPVTHPEGFTTEVSADGTNWGNPEVAIAQIISALSYGDLVSQTHVGNRQPVLHIRISAPSGGILPLGEKALAAVVGKPVELVWQPLDLTEPPTVFDVVHSSMEFSLESMDERRRQRAYVVTMSALPWGRSAQKVMTASVLPAAPTTVDSGSATTNWTASAPTGAAVSVVTGAVTNTYNPALTRPDGFYGALLRRAATFSTATNKLIAIDWKSSLPGAHGLNINSNPYANEVEVRREPAPTVGFTRSWYRVSDTTTSVSVLLFGIIHPQGSGSATLSIDQVLTANALPAVGTARQLTATIAPAGSVTAEGDVIVQHASAGLGQTIVFSHPTVAGYSPPISQWRTTSNTPTVDSTTTSGQRISLITTPAQFEIPVDSVPQGDVQLWARMRLATGSAAQVSVFVGAGSAMGAAVFDAEDRKTSVSLPGGAAWAIVPLLRLALPTRNLGPNGKVRIALLRDTVVDLELDEAWLFGMDRGRLTVVDCGTGTPATGTVHNRLRVTAPSLAAPFGRIEVATASDWSDSVTPSATRVSCDQTGHRFDPDGSGVFTVTSGTTSALTSLEHYPRWHSNAGVV